MPRFKAAYKDFVEFVLGQHGGRCLRRRWSAAYQFVKMRWRLTQR
jgi:hypothetical protein